MSKNDSTVVLSRLLKLHPKIIDLSLDRVRRLLTKLDNPEKKLPPVVHIAGTNGKGSTLALIRAGLESEKKKVHTFTSPHLIRINERIVIAGSQISDTLLSNYLTTSEGKNSTNNITFFEIITCAAFLAFSQNKADYTLLEVGLGGRLDATNVVEKPVISIITPISLDHQNFLGGTLAKIAKEKSGILKPGCLAIIGKQKEEALDVILKVAEQKGTKLSVYGRDWFSSIKDDKLVFEDEEGQLELPKPKLTGNHQYDNAGIAIAALRGLKISEQGLRNSVKKVDWPARLQNLRTGPLVKMVKDFHSKNEIWLDGGHNMAAGQAMANFLSKPFDGKNYLICGMINSKDVYSYLYPFRKVLSEVIGIKIPNEGSSQTKDDISFQAKKIFLYSSTSDTLDKAVKKILSRDTNQVKVRILIGGSLYLSGHVLKNHT